MMTARYPLLKQFQKLKLTLFFGDSCLVVLGHDDTLSVTVDEMLHHVKAVTNANHLRVVRTPYLSYHIISAIKNAGRFIKAKQML